MSDPTPCTVERRCSSAGKLCSAEDRECQSAAVAGGLEITCERSEPSAYLYCPPGASSRDGSVVWLLLAVALAIAIGGSIAAYFLLRGDRNGRGPKRA